MELVNFTSFKGGAGKTTALMAVCSCLLERGKKVAIFEADDNRPISKWRDNAIEKGTWHDNCSVLIADTLSNFEAAYEEASKSGYHIALADSQGGGSNLNDMILINSDFIVLPTALTTLDADEVIETYQHVIKTLAREGLEIDLAILKTRVPTSKLTQSQMRTSTLLDELPVFSQPLHLRDAFADMKFKGLLHQTILKMKQNPNDALHASHFQKAIDEADIITADILSALENATNGN
ncbi:hypothetical protein [Roseibium sp. TrichSKD4]|uniref:nucleotide-binding protein n=1 Tax=Roseibium sp. TrichSKD4 TaxID=744980 RepID=UPI00031F1ECC|nr:hypothetical protein [Roseibium sp. TrichSKD4]